MSFPSYRLEIISDIKSPWYNQPKKNNYIILEIRLIDSNEKIIQFNQTIPLKVSLYYQDGKLVDKNILTINGNTSLNRDSQSTIINVRIEDVSSIHQGKLFVIRVSPNSQMESMNQKIASVDSIPIKVMSKAPKDGRNSIGGLTSSNINGENNEIPHIHHISPNITHNNIGGSSVGGGHLIHSMMPIIGGDYSESPNKRLRVESTVYPTIQTLPYSYDLPAPTFISIPLTSLNEIKLLNEDMKKILNQ